MANRPFTPKLAASAERHRFLRGSPYEVNSLPYYSSLSRAGQLTLLQFFLADAFNLRTLVLGGALIQIGLSSILPTRWAIVPASTLLFTSIVKTIFQMLSPRDNLFMKGVIPGRTTAQLPTEFGAFGPDPANQSVVVFHLGIQWNHPLGFFAPGVAEISKHFLAMSQELLLRRDELGLLSVSDWRGAERGRNNTYLIAYYFKDVESIHRFAHEDLHRMAWDNYASTKPAHIGVFHETFEVPARAYESMYVNCHPLLLGRGLVACEDKEGEEMWVNTLVSADTPALKTQYARMGRDETGVPKPEYSE